jgi:hypothetical protein
LAVGWGGGPNKKPTPPLMKNPPFTRILIAKTGYTQTSKVEPGLSIQITPMKIAEEARLESRSAWLLCTTGRDPIQETTELVNG